MLSRIARVIHWLAQHLAGSPLRAGLAATVFGFAGGMLSLQTVMVTTLRHLDSDGYFQIADCLREGYGFRFWPDRPPETHRPPIYPLICVPFSALPDPWAMPAYIAFQSVMMGLSCSLAHRIANRLAGPDVASFAALLFMLHPGLLLCSPAPTPWYWEMFVYTSLCWSILVVLQFDPREWSQAPLARRLSVGLGWGVLMGVLCLTHGAKLLTVPLVLAGLGVWALWYRRFSLWPPLAVAGLVCALMIAPWSYRNWTVLHRFVPLATNSGYAYFLGDARWGIGDVPFPPDEPWRLTGLRCAGIPGTIEQRVEFWSLRNPQDDFFAEKQMRERIRRRPVEFVAKIGLNGVDQFLPAIRFVYQKVRGLTARSWLQVVAHSQFQKALMMSLYNGVLIGLAVVAMLRRWSDFRPPGVLWVVLGLIAAFCLPYYPFLVSAQSLFNYTFAVLPLLCTLASVTLIRWFPRPPEVQTA